MRGLPIRGFPKVGSRVGVIFVPTFPVGCGDSRENRYAVLLRYDSCMMMQPSTVYMQRCIELAQRARQSADTLVGSLVVHNDQIIGEGVEAVRARLDVTAHAEIEAIRQACRNVHSLDLTGSVLYTTAEPCWMCSYAVRQTRISQVVIGRSVPSVGGFSSRHPILTDPDIEFWPSPPSVTCGVLGRECEKLNI